MRNVLIDIILRLEDYLLTAQGRHKVSDLFNMSDDELKKLADECYNTFKNLI